MPNDSYRPPAPATLPRRFRVALTGGIGSGKSSAADHFAALGAQVIDADELSRALTAPGGAALPAIAAELGADLIDPDGVLDRARLRERVFADPTARRTLEAILHPRIRAQMLAAADGARSGTGASGDVDHRSLAPYVIFAIPLLFETGQQRHADRVLVIDCPEALQIERVIARSGLTADAVRRIIASQVSRDQRLAGADDIIDNSGTLTALQRQVASLHQRYLALAAATPAA